MDDLEIYNLKLSMLSTGENAYSKRILRLIKVIEDLKLNNHALEERARLWEADARELARKLEE